MPDRQRETLDDAFDRIEGTILPCIGMMLETLLNAAELETTEAYAVELCTLALQLEALTREIERVPPSRIDRRPGGEVAVSR